MNITPEVLEGLITAVIILALSTERGIELVKPLFLKIADPNWQKVAKIGAASVLGFAVSALVKFDPLAQLGFNLSPWAGYAAAGLLASAGASPWHALLEWLKTIKAPVE